MPQQGLAEVTGVAGGGDGGRPLYSRRTKPAAATRSSRLEVKLVSAKSPALSPMPVKSKRTTPMPRSARARLMRTIGLRSLEQVKQWAKRAMARGSSGGRSTRAASWSPKAPSNLTRSLLLFIDGQLLHPRVID
jgi:hypothetical protein